MHKGQGIISRTLHRGIHMFHWTICFLHYGVAIALCLVIIVFGCKLIPHFWDDMCYVCKDKLATRSEYKEYQYMSKRANRDYYTTSFNATVTYRLCKYCKAPAVIPNASLFDCWGIKVGHRASTIPICLAGIFLAILVVLSFVMAQRSRHILASGENPSWCGLYNIQAPRRRISTSSRSGLAAAAFWTSMFSFPFLIPAPIAVVLGIYALRDIRRNPTKKGKWMAVSAIITGSLTISILVFFSSVNLSRKLQKKSEPSVVNSHQTTKSKRVAVEAIPVSPTDENTRKDAIGLTQASVESTGGKVAQEPQPMQPAKQGETLTVPILPSAVLEPIPITMPAAATTTPSIETDVKVGQFPAKVSGSTQEATKIPDTVKKIEQSKPVVAPPPPVKNNVALKLGEYQKKLGEAMKSLEVAKKQGDRAKMNYDSATMQYNRANDDFQKKVSDAKAWKRKPPTNTQALDKCRENMDNMEKSYSAINSQVEKLNSDIKNYNSLIRELKAKGND